MADDVAAPARRGPGFDTTVAHSARIWNYWLGGKDNYAADRQAGDKVAAMLPSIVAQARADRAFLGRAIRYLAGEAGIRQFLDIGTGIPKENNVHEVAQLVVPQARIVYADYDPIVLAHAHKLLTSTPEGACAYIYGDLRNPEVILRKAADTLDFSKPTAVVLFGILHFFADTEHPDVILAQLVEALAPGSYLAISHLARDVHGEALTETFDRLNQQMSESVSLRTRDEVTRFFDGLDLVDPGVVQLPQWQPDPVPEGAQPARSLPMWCAVGRKP